MIFILLFFFFFFQAEDGIRDHCVTGVQTCALPILTPATVSHHLKILSEAGLIACRREGQFVYSQAVRSEEHTSELQSHSDLVCRLLLEKKKNTLRTSASGAKQQAICRVE